MFAKTMSGNTMPISPMPVSSSKPRFWINMIALVAAIACALALVIATLGAVAVATAGTPAQSGPSSAIPTQTYEGMVTDTRCGAKHSAKIGATAADCTLLCVRAGEKFILVDGNASYLLDGDPIALKQVAGQRARILGTLSGRTISVTSVATT
jgi:uncharacterized low-complexity protein